MRLLRSGGGGNVLSGGGTLALDTVVADAQGSYSLSFQFTAVTRPRFRGDPLPPDTVRLTDGRFDLRY